MKRAICILLTAGFLACAGGASAPDARYPKRPEGCDVELFHAAPDKPTDNIGPVTARCAEEISQDECIRTLKDAACDLGGDVVWGVSFEPQKKDGKNVWNGRAAHTKVR